MFTVQHIDHVAITVSDMRRSIEWYTDVLALERRHPEWDDPGPVMLCAGDTCLALFAASGGQPKSPPGRDHIAMRHFAFRVDRANFESARSELPERGISYEFADHGACHSIYIEDPDGHTIEITTYELT